MIDFNQILHSKDFFDVMMLVIVCFIISLILTVIFKKKMNIFVFLAYATIATIGYLAVNKQEVKTIEKKEVRIQEDKKVIEPKIEQKIEKKQNPNIKIEMN